MVYELERRRERFNDHLTELMDRRAWQEEMKIDLIARLLDRNGRPQMNRPYWSTRYQDFSRPSSTGPNRPARPPTTGPNRPARPHTTGPNGPARPHTGSYGLAFPPTGPDWTGPNGSPSRPPLLTSTSSQCWLSTAWNTNNFDQPSCSFARTPLRQTPSPWSSSVFQPATPVTSNQHFNAHSTAGQWPSLPSFIFNSYEQRPTLPSSQPTSNEQFSSLRSTQRETEETQQYLFY